MPARTLTNESIEHRLALATCRGPRQEAIVREMQRGPIEISNNNRRSYGPVWIAYGQTRVGSSSFNTLKKRLTMLGFVFERARDPKTGISTITMTFPEGQSNDSKEED